MANLSVIIGIIGNVISILMFASPIRTFKKVVKNKSTENYKGLPYMSTLLSTSLWTYYGLSKPGGLLIATVNSVGASLHVIYVILFLIYAPRIVKVKSMKFVGILNVGFLGAVILICQLAFRRSLRITVVGVICAGLTIAMYAAPLSAMRMVIKMRSVQYMPFFLSCTQFLNGAVWFTYAFLVKDYYIGVPNGIGLLLGSTQLVLYMIYRGKSSVPENKVNENEAEQKLSMKKNPCLNKGYSLPKAPVAREYSRNICKTVSSSAYELRRADAKDIEKGFKERT